MAEIVPPHRSPVVAAATGAAMIPIAAVLVAGVEETLRSGPNLGVVILASVMLVIELFLGFMTRFFLAPRGGVRRDDATGTLCLGTYGGPENDVRVSISGLRRLRVSPRWEEVRRSERQLLALELERKDGPPVLVGEHEDGARVERVAQLIADALGLPIEREDTFVGRLPHVTGTASGPEVCLGRSWPLFRPLTTLGVLMLLSGVLLVVTTGSFFFGVIVAPFLAVLGLVLLAVSFSLTFGRERIEVSEERIVHRIMRGSRTIFESSIEPTDKLRVRVHPNGARGAAVELVTPNRVLVIGNGLSAGTSPPVSRIDELAAALQRLLYTNREVPW